MVTGEEPGSAETRRFLAFFLCPFVFTHVVAANYRIKGILGERWAPGTPFEATKLAVSVIPVFPDDQKAVQLKKLSEERSLDAATVLEFFDRLPLTQSDSTAFYFLTFKEVDSTTKDTEEKPKSEEGTTTTANIADSPDSLGQLLGAHQFNSLSATQTSTAKILEQLADGLEGVQHSHFMFAKEASQLPEKAEPKKVARPPSVNNLQGLVKRKKQN